MQRRRLLNQKIKRLVSEFEERTNNQLCLQFDDQELFDIISFYEKEQLLHKAIEAVDLALEQYQYRVDFYLMKVRLLLKEQDYTSAFATLEQAENISPYELDIQLMKAKTLNTIGQPIDALEILDHLRTVTAPSDWTEIMKVEASSYESLKDYDSMFDVLKDALILNPVRMDLLEKMWMAVEFSKKYAESVRFHDQLIELEPYNAYAWYNLGHAYSCQMEYQKSIDALEYSFLIDPEFEMGYKDCAELCMQTCQFEKAYEIYKEELDLFGADSDLLACLGECCIELQMHQEARHHLMKASRLDPYNDEVHYLLGRCATVDQRWKDAIRYYQKALDIEDRREEYFAGIAEAFAHTREITKADYYFRKATEAGPEQLVFWLQHARFLMDIKASSEALLILEEAEYHTVGVELTYCKAACLYRLELFDQALNVLEEALREDVCMKDLLFEYAPELKKEERVQSMIKYFIGELPL